MQALALRILELQRTVRQYDEAYYVNHSPQVSDAEYDAIVRELETLKAGLAVGSDANENFVKRRHRFPMLSIDNVFAWGTQPGKDVLSFAERVRRSTTRAAEYVAEYKVDGVALELVYESGKLTTALTRGDGVTGDDVTANASVIAGIPQTLEGNDIPSLVEVRGEVVISRENFKAVNEQRAKDGEPKFVNARNAASGALKSLDVAACEARKLRFLSHSMGYQDDPTIETLENFEAQCAAWGFTPVPQQRLGKELVAAFRAIEVMCEESKNLPYEVDGIVVKVNQLAIQTILGCTAKAPRWVVAYKWAKYEAVTKVLGITVQVGKTGVLTPVAELQPVQIDGTEVSRASLHNADEIKRLDVRVGDSVVVEKAGKIIPHVVKVVKELRTESCVPYQFPDKCPTCGGPVSRKVGGVYIKCTNSNCQTRLLEKLKFFVSRAAMDIEGLGEQQLRQLIRRRLVKSIPDIYLLKHARFRMMNAECTNEKSVNNLLDAVEKSKTQPLWRVLVGLSIPGVGTTTAQALAHKFKTILQVRTASVQTLQDVPGIHTTSAEAIYNYFQDDGNVDTVLRLLAEGLTMPHKEPDKSVSVALEGLTVVVTGKLQKYTRATIEQAIKLHGGACASSVSAKIDILVAGDSAGSKLAKAQKLKVRVVSEDEFTQMLRK